MSEEMRQIRGRVQLGWHGYSGEFPSLRDIPAGVEAMFRDMEQLLAEIDRLRKALRDIAACDAPADMYDLACQTLKENISSRATWAQFGSGE